MQKDDSEEKIEREKVEQGAEEVVVVVGYWMKKNRDGGELSINENDEDCRRRGRKRRR